MARRKSHDEGEEKAAPSDLVDSDVRPQSHSVYDATQTGPQAVDMTGYEGEYIKKTEQADWEAHGSPPDKPVDAYGLMIVDNDPYGHTHHAQNNDHHWSGTKDQFEDQFKEA